ncbi:helix-turn-helix domain-containing protein [Streptomyces mirabilis]|uniref:helix-turn-helix domain-containing protein n=1 Tax=Streptomyces mirabilis TaxID=68239 RepID=UPI0036D8AADD
MGRPEKPVDRTVPERGKLADFLRERRSRAGLTYAQLSKLATGIRSKATLERAASGSSVPAWETVSLFINLTLTQEEMAASAVGPAFTRGLELWIRARRATRAPFYVHKAPDPDLISTKADLLRGLRRQHVWAGYPTPGEMERMSGAGELPCSTTRRVIKGEILPVDPRQTIAFLKACYVVRPTDLEPWLAAATRTHHGAEGEWLRAYQKVLAQIQKSTQEEILVGIPVVTLDVEGYEAMAA